MILREAVPRAAKLIRALVDAGGELAAEDARQIAAEPDLHHMVQSLNNAARRHGSRLHGSRTALLPLESLRERGSRGTRHRLSHVC